MLTKVYTFLLNAEAWTGRHSGVLMLAMVTAFLLLEFNGCFHQPTSLPVVHLTDTVYVPRPAPPIIVKVAERSAPEKVYVYLPDSLLRQKVQGQRIITGVTVSRQKIDIQTIEPNGVVSASVTSLLDIPTEARIDNQGYITVINDKRAQRKLWWKKTGHKAVVVVAAVAGVFIGTKL